MDVRPAVRRSLHTQIAVMGLACLSAALPVGCSSRLSSTHVVFKPTAQEEDSDGKRSIKALGRIQPDGGVLSITGTPGTRIAMIRVQEGHTVAANEELFRLDTYDVLDANCRSIQAQLDEAEELLAVEEDNSAHVARELELEEAQLQTLDPLDIEAQGERLKALDLKLTHEEAEARRLKALRDAKSSLVSEQQIEAQGLLVDGARAERNGAKAVLEKIKAGHTLALRKVALQRSQLAISSRKARLTARKKSLTAGLAAAQRQRDQAQIRAPKEGRILKVLMHDGETIGNQPVLQMGDTRTMCIMADVSDLYIRDLRRAKQAKATALGDSLVGTINPSEIGRIVGKTTLPSLDPTVDADRRVVEVKVRLDGPSSTKAADLTNLQVDILISLDDSSTEAQNSNAALPIQVGRTER